MKKYIFIGFLLASTFLHSSPVPHGFIFTELGGSFSRCANISVNTNIWEPTLEGYNSTLGRIPLSGIGVGYYVTNWLTITTNLNRRGSYEFCKFQTFQTPQTQDTSNELVQQTRLFQMDNVSFMINLLFNRAGAYSCLQYNLFNKLGVAPYFGAGIGFCENLLYNFRSVLDQEVVVNNNFKTNLIGSLMSAQSTVSFAWQLMTGLSFFVNDCADISIGYRYYNGGTFETNDYLLDINLLEGTPITIPPWKGKLRAHEIVVGLYVNI